MGPNIFRPFRAKITVGIIRINKTGWVQSWIDSAIGQRGKRAMATGKNKQWIAQRPEMLIPNRSQKADSDSLLLIN